MATELEAARLLTYQAATLETKGLSYERASAMSGLFAREMAIKVTLDAVQIFGGYGYMKDYPVERYMRDATMTQSNEGIDEMQKLVTE